MTISRRILLAATATGAAAFSAQAATGLDAAQFGVRPDSSRDQTQALQQAIDRAALTRLPLYLPPGIYRSGELYLTPYARIQGVRGATRLELQQGATLLRAERADTIGLSGLTLDGRKLASPQGRALVHLQDAADLRIDDCTLLNAGAGAVTLERCGGAVTSLAIEQTGDAAIRAIDSVGLRIAGNIIRHCGNNGIQVWRSAAGDDGTLVCDNRIEQIRNDAGGNGPNGNGINIFRAGNVIVRGNRIDQCAYSAVRGNSASNIQIAGNTCTRIGECAIWSEFAFQGAVISGNIVDGAAVGIAVANFNNGGRLAVVSNNILRNIGTTAQAPGLGLSIEADSVVTGNVIETKGVTGIRIGYGPYLRDVVVSSNVLRGTSTGIAVTVVRGAGSVLISDNLIEAQEAALVGMEWEKRVTGDLLQEGAGRHAHLALSGNRAR